MNIIAKLEELIEEGKLQFPIKQTTKKVNHMQKEIPILFSTPMVQAILSGRKTMTRRIVKPQPHKDDDPWLVPRILGNEYDWGKWYWDTEEGERIVKFCPYGNPGDILWVRENYKVNGFDDSGGPQSRTIYGRYEDGVLIPNVKLTDDEWEKFCRWKNEIGRKPSLFMFKSLARIWLEVTDIRVERLHDITEADAKAEGVEQNPDGSWHDYLEPERLWQDAAKPSFQSLWMKINGEDSWNGNPWVWVVSFKVLSTTGKALNTTTNADQLQRISS